MEKITGTKTNTDANKIVKPGDTFDYNIVLTNSGNVEGTAKVTDEVPDTLEITGTTPRATVNGNSVDFGDVSVVPGTPTTLTLEPKTRDLPVKSPKAISSTSLMYSPDSSKN